MSERRHPNVINIDEVKPNTREKGRHKITARTLGPHAGNAQLGATLTEIPPGAVSYPRHYHCAIEESLYVVSGRGTARIGDARVAVRAGDWIAHPVGPDHAHQMINDGDEPLVYLAVSTITKCEVVVYPDSKKIGAMGGEYARPWVRTLSRDGESLDYWEGEPEAK
jgi:uncharacterized cupin superfamily protein